jgi:hypothetical protein
VVTADGGQHCWVQRTQAMSQAKSAMASIRDSRLGISFSFLVGAGLGGEEDVSEGSAKGVGFSEGALRMEGYMRPLEGGMTSYGSLRAR